MFEESSNLEFGTVSFGIISDKETKEFAVAFSKQHKNAPKAILVSYETYGYFYGSCHVFTATMSNTGFKGNLIPIEIGNGQGKWTIHWIALWDN